MRIPSYQNTKRKSRNYSDDVVAHRSSYGEATADDAFIEHGEIVRLKRSKRQELTIVVGISTSHNLSSYPLSNKFPCQPLSFSNFPSNSHSHNRLPPNSRLSHSPSQFAILKIETGESDELRSPVRSLTTWRTGFTK
jgi:hypothetical protein